jgi:hypothetical protein
MLLHSKGKVTRVKKQPTEWEKIFASFISDKELMTRIYPELQKPNSKRINDPMNKWSNELNKKISKGTIFRPKHT